MQRTTRKCHVPTWHGRGSLCHRPPTISPDQSGLCGAISRTTPGASSSYDGASSIWSRARWRASLVGGVAGVMVSVLADVQEQPGVSERVGRKLK